MSIRTCGLLLVFVLVSLTADSSPLPNNGHQDEALDDPDPVVTLCSANATRCWAEGSLLHSNGSCYPALTRGPCAEGQWWLLPWNGSLADVRGQCSSMTCPPDASSTECRSRMQWVADTCPRRPDGAPEFAVHLDPKGDFRCGVFPGRAEALRALVVCLSLTNSQLGPLDVVRSNGRECVQNDQGRCAEVSGNTQPSIAFTSED